MYVVYCVTCTVTGDQYVGVTSNFEARIKQHKKYFNLETSDRSHYPLYIAMKLHGFDNFTFSVLENDIEVAHDAANLEKKYIKEMNPTYNKINGGSGHEDFVDTNAIISLYKEIKIGNDVAKILGYDASTVYDILKKNNIEIDMDYLLEKRRKPVECYDLKTGNPIKKYDSVKEASIDLSGSRNGSSAIAKCCDGKTRSYYKMGWKYV